MKLFARILPVIYSVNDSKNLNVFIKKKKLKNRLSSLPTSRFVHFNTDRTAIQIQINCNLLLFNNRTYFDGSCLKQ